MPETVKPLSPDKLRLVCDPATFTFETTAELEPTTAIIGQPRAIKALEFGMGLKSKGYNIFVIGSPGTGRSTAIRHFLQERCRQEPTPNDWIYLYNFDSVHRPNAVALPPGEGVQFADRMKKLVEDLQQMLTQALEGTLYRDAVHLLEQKLNEQREEKIGAVERKANEQGLTIQEAPSGPVVVPLEDEEGGEPAEGNGEYLARREAQRTLQVELRNILRDLRALERENREERRQLDQEVAQSAIQDEIEALREQYAGQPALAEYLNALYDDLLEQVTRAAPMMDDKDLDQVIDLRRYEVNTFVDNSDGQGAPVIVQLNPTYDNLFGRLEYESQGHGVTTHFTQIKPGDLHKANGGYLVMYASDLIRQRDTWDALKRTLKAEEIEVRPPQSDGPIISNTLTPQPIPLLLKVILLGSGWRFYSSFESDEEFSDLFKVRADFSDTMPRDAAHEHSYAEFIASRGVEEKLRPFGGDAVAKIVEHGSRLAEHQSKLSTLFGAIGDLAREANYWAGIEGREIVTAGDVRRALVEQIHRTDQPAENYRESILEGSIFIATEGSVVGQVNGLTVTDLGEFSYSHPGRISASTFMGDSGVIHIERETEMSGPSHDKGVLTLIGYLGGAYAQRQPLSLNASLTFDQLYGGIDGDSASSAELYALLSSLSRIPLRQGIGVTGSVNQRGEVQTIGAANEKIEGFFDVCRARGLTGDQGVLIPATNVCHLMLREDVIEAVRQGQFHIWPVTTIDEGIELLTDTPAGQPDKDGHYPRGTVHYAVKKRLEELALELKAFGDHPAEPARKTKSK